MSLRNALRSVEMKSSIITLWPFILPWHHLWRVQWWGREAFAPPVIVAIRGNNANFKIATFFWVKPWYQSLCRSVTAIRKQPRSWEDPYVKAIAEYCSKFLKYSKDGYYKTGGTSTKKANICFKCKIHVSLNYKCAINAAVFWMCW